MKRIINAAFALALVGALGTMFTHDALAQQKGTGTSKGVKFVDQDGDGVCDNVGSNAGKGMGVNGKGKGYGPADGTGYKGQGPKDGTGNGAKGINGTGTGVCDGTGPKGNQNRGRK